MSSSSSRKTRVLSILLIVVSEVLLLVWLTYTPSGLLGKMDAIGYAICHRIPERSFHIGDRAMPMCARCTGMYLGAFITFLFQFQRGRGGKLPGRKILIILGLFFLAFAVDSINSYLHFFPNIPSLYDPHNWLRLVTGSGVGIGMAAILLPAFNQTIWADWRDESLLSTWKDLVSLLGLAAIGILLTLTNNFYFLIPIAIVSSLTVFLLLSMIYVIIWVLVYKRENMYKNNMDLWRPALAGMATALLQVALFDLGRYIFTGTWGGFILM